ncbi:MAG: hypothetical protein DRN27_06770 [Thermoplasmata archaeon]|nr:MAG: hypothetical protein DRN27_06770 [Thermoplasmata archaeon]
MSLLIKSKWTIVLVTTLMILVSFSGLTAADDKDNSHTVLVELKCATNCPYCPSQENAVENLVGDYEYYSLAFQTYQGTGWNTDIEDREDELDSGQGFPTSYFDGGYELHVGGGSPQSGMQADLDSCAARTVADIDLDLMVMWSDGAELEIDLDVINTGSTAYQGHVHVYITEIESRWDNYDGVPFNQALLSLQSDADITVNPSQTWNTNFVWDGDDYGYGDITSDNIKVIAAVFDQSTDYTDETISALPITNLAPTADFSIMPEYPEALETITFSDDSIDTDGTIVSWDWDFGDTATSNLENPTHSYAAKGYYTVTLNIEDDDGAVDTISKMIVVVNPGEMLHVGQTVFERGFPIRHAVDGDWAGAQSFEAASSIVTNVDLYLRKFGTPEFDLTIELREVNPEGNLLDTVVIPQSLVPSGWGWLAVDFTDTTVVPGTEYCIVCPPAPSGVTTSFGYEWGYAFGNPYNDGAFWFTRDGGALWRDLPTMYEFTFSAFGI